jgi:hypothetical protein
MTLSRVVAILVGIAVMVIFDRLVALNWYVNFVLGMIVYLVARYALWAIAERRRFKGEFDQFVKDHREK